MYSCPNCNEKTFSITDKFKAHSLKPATCNMCGGLAVPKSDDSVLPVFVGMFGVPLVLFTGHILKSWIPLCIFTIAALVVCGISFHRKPMIEANMEKAKKQHWLAFYVLVVILGWLVYDGILK